MALPNKLYVTLVAAMLIVILINQYRFVPLESRPHLTVVGTAEIEVAPGEAHLSGNFVNRANSQATANSTNAKAVTGIIDQLKEIEVNETDITTSSISVYPEYDYRNMQSGKPSITGYRASTTVTVKLKQTDLADKVLAKMNEAKAESVTGPSFNLSGDDIRAYQNEAQAKALADAAGQAEALVIGMNRKLGAIITVNPNSGGGGISPVYQTSRAANDLASTTADSAGRVSAGTQTISATVTVTYSLK